jgi:hypothetical protein
LSGILVGLGAVATLVSDRPRKGEHRFHRIRQLRRHRHCSCMMAKGRRDRAAEEDFVSRAIVLWLARACGIAAPSPRSLLDADEHYMETVDQLLAGELGTKDCGADSIRSYPRPRRRRNEPVGVPVQRAMHGGLSENPTARDRAASVSATDAA